MKLRYCNVSFWSFWHIKYAIAVKAVKTSHEFTQFNILVFFITKTLKRFSYRWLLHCGDHIFMSYHQETSWCPISNESRSNIKNANALLIQFDSCLLFQSHKCRFFIRNKNYNLSHMSPGTATWLRSHVFVSEWCSKPNVDDLRSLWQRDPTLNKIVLLIVCLRSHFW